MGGDFEELVTTVVEAAREVKEEYARKHARLEKLEKERVEQKQRADAWQKESLRDKARIDALEKVVEAARKIQSEACHHARNANLDWCHVRRETLLNLRAALDATEPKDDWLASSLDRAERDGTTARIGPEDEPLYIPAPSAKEPGQVAWRAYYKDGKGHWANVPEYDKAHWATVEQAVVSAVACNRVAPAVENTGQLPSKTKCPHDVPTTQTCRDCLDVWAKTSRQPITRAEFDQLRADVTTVALIQRQDYDPHSGVYADLTDIIQRGEKARET